MDNRKKLGQALVILAALAVTAGYVLPIFQHPHALLSDDPYRFHDYLQQATYDHLFRQAILEHGQFALRTHMLGGGYPLIGNPQNVSFSPFSLVSLIAGEALGIKINLLLFFLIGAAGMILLCRKGLDIPLSGSIFAALAYVLSSWWASRVEWGFYFKFYFHLFPLAFYFYIMARNAKKYLFLCAITFVVIISQIGLGFVAMLLFLVCWELVEYLSTIKTERRPVFIRRFLILILAIFLLGAVRILPMMGVLSKNPRTVSDYQTYETTRYPSFYKGAAHFGHALIASDPTPNYPIHPGWGTLVLAAIGAAVAFRKSWKFNIMLLLFVWLCFGPYLPIDLFRLLWRFPLFHSMNMPYQLFNYFVLLGLVILAGYAFTLLDRLPGRILPCLLSFAVFLFLIQPLSDNHLVYKSTFLYEAPQLPVESDFYQVHGKDLNRGAPRTPHSHQYYNVLRNIGTIDWDGDVILKENARPKYLVDRFDNVEENPDYKGEVFLRDGNGEANLLELKPNSMVLEAQLIEPDWVVVNQNFETAWRSSGFEVKAYEGLIAVPINTPGTYTVILKYRPWRFYVGLAISILSWGGLLWVFARRKLNVAT